jgi:hypothetical protein
MKKRPNNELWELQHRLNSRLNEFNSRLNELLDLQHRLNRSILSRLNELELKEVKRDKADEKSQSRTPVTNDTLANPIPSEVVK